MIIKVQDLLHFFLLFLLSLVHYCCAVLRLVLPALMVCFEPHRKMRHSLYLVTGRMRNPNHDIRLRGMRGPMGLPIQKRRSSGRISRWRCGEFLVQFSPSANRETSGFRRKCVFSFILKVIIDFHYYFSKFHVLRHLW